MAAISCRKRKVGSLKFSSAAVFASLDFNVDNNTSPCNNGKKNSLVKPILKPNNSSFPYSTRNDTFKNKRDISNSSLLPAKKVVFLVEENESIADSNNKENGDSSIDNIFNNDHFSFSNNSSIDKDIKDSSNSVNDSFNSENEFKTSAFDPISLNVDACNNDEKAIDISPQESHAIFPNYSSSGIIKDIENYENEIKLIKMNIKNLKQLKRNIQKQQHKNLFKAIFGMS